MCTVTSKFIGLENMHKEWRSIFTRQLPSTMDEISQFIQIKENPTFIFLNNNEQLMILNLFNLENWVKAITYQSEIYVFFDHKEVNWQNIIRHELFHVGTSQVLGNVKLIPYWFNEAIAYYVGNNDAYDKRKLYEYLQPNFNIVLKSLYEDSILTSDCQYKYEIIQSFGFFFCEKYGTEKVKNVFHITAESKDFNLALKKITNMDSYVLMGAWLNFLKKNLKAQND